MNIWFNHWFSTAYHLIRLMRAAGDDLRFFGTGTNPRAIYREAVDVWEDEPEFADDGEYVAWALAFCRTHAVSVFVPRRRLAAIVEARDAFEAMGVQLFAPEDAALVRALDDKGATYELLRAWGLGALVPPYRMAHTIAEFRAAVDALSGDGGRVCYKLAVDEGATTFRVIDDTLAAAGALYRMPGAKATRAAAEAILGAYDFAVPVLVMPYLEGPEISVDALMTERGDILLPRYKGGRYSTLHWDAEVVTLSKELLHHLAMRVPANLQFRMHKGKPYLLEINPRMAGGLQLSCAASGVNVPAVALAQLLGRGLPWQLPQETDVTVANIETPIVLGEGRPHA